MKLQENETYLIINKENHTYSKLVYISTEVNKDEICLVFKHTKTKDITTIYDLNVIEIHLPDQPIHYIDLTKYAEY